MSNLVERLRGRLDPPTGILREAADEIELLLGVITAQAAEIAELGKECQRLRVLFVEAEQDGAEASRDIARLRAIIKRLHDV